MDDMIMFEAFFHHIYYYAVHMFGYYVVIIFLPCFLGMYTYNKYRTQNLAYHTLKYLILFTIGIHGIVMCVDLLAFRLSYIEETLSIALFHLPLAVTGLMGFINKQRYFWLCIVVIAGSYHAIYAVSPIAIAIFNYRYPLLSDLPAPTFAALTSLLLFSCYFRAEWPAYKPATTR